MIFFGIFFSQVIWSYSAFITSDTALYRNFDYIVDSTFVCMNGNSKQPTIPFSGTFANIPQVIMVPEKYDTYLSMDYRLEITAITTTSFTAKIMCPASTRVCAVRFRWFAIDNQNIQVINQFTWVPNQKQYILNHSNPNALDVFAVLTSFGYTGAIDFTISVTSITTTDVTVEITNLAGLTQFGFQIVLGTEGSFKKEGLYFTTINYSKTFDRRKNNWLIIPFQGYTYQNQINLHTNTTYSVSIGDSSDTVSYQLWSWESFYASNTHLEYQVPYVFTKIFKPLLCSFVRISQSLQVGLVSQSPITLEIQQLTLKLTNPGVYKFIVNKTINLLNINVYFQCQQGKKIQSQFNTCSSCAVDYLQSQNHFCHGEINTIGYITRYSQQLQAYEELIVTLTSSSCQIQQVLYNQVISTVTILKIAYLNS